MRRKPEVVLFPGHFKPFQVMLAAKPRRGENFDQWAAKLRLPLWETPKIDGIRCVTLDIPGDKADWQCCPLTRSLKTFPNRHVANEIGLNCPPGLDGELITFTQKELGDIPDPYYVVSSALLSEDGEPRFRYLVFDYITPDTKHCGYLERLSKLQQLKLPTFCQILMPDKINTVDELRERVNQRMDEGYEGSCLRTGSHPYKFGRSSIRQQGLVAVKLFEDSDAVVTGWEPLLRNMAEPELNYAGHKLRPRLKGFLKPDELVGKLIGRDLNTKQVVVVGSGFTDSQRRDLWLQREKLAGRVFKYKHQPYGAKDIESGKRRLPVFLGFRDDIRPCA